MRKSKVIRKYLQYKQNRRVDFSSIGAEMSRHVGAKSQRFWDFNFSKAFFGQLFKTSFASLLIRRQSTKAKAWKISKT
jgi:hypothetical protein